MVKLEFSEIRRDFFYKKKVVVYQGKRGYRFSVDSPILADFILSQPHGRALDIGTGCGIIPVLLLYKKKFFQVTGCEIQNTLVRLAEMNARENGFIERFKVVHCDFKEKYLKFKGYKTIFSNPPFFKLTIGKLSPNMEIRHAKAEVNLTLNQLLGCVVPILANRGSLFLVLPYERFEECLSLAGSKGLFTRRIRKVFSFQDGKPERFLVQLTNYQGTPEELAPLVIFKGNGIYSEEMERILTGI